MRKNFVAFLLVLTLLATSGLGQAVRITPAERKIAAGITADQMSSYLHFVASDAMEGRDTPSRGLDTTAEFLKMNLSRWGFKPAGDNGTFFQKIELTADVADPVNNLLQIDGRTFTVGTDFLRLAGNGSANALMVFGGNGWMIKAKNIDAFKGVDVTGKFVVLLGNGLPRLSTLTQMPSGTSRADLSGTKGQDWADPVTYAAQKGAAGIILIGSAQHQSGWDQLRQFTSRGSMAPTKLRNPPPKLPVVMVSNVVANVIFDGASAGKDSSSAFNIDKTVSMTTMSRTETKWTQNVVALWEGRDPVLKNEYVVVGAHYDHVGYGSATNSYGPLGRIHNGADDNGSGTAGSR